MAVKGVKAWTEKLGTLDMPVLGNVIKELNVLTGSDDSEVNQLADVILKDANLTSQVLRIANSVHYNPSNYPINTISRAIVLIGFTGVRAICISVMMIDSLLKDAPREHLLETMARGFHAAVQARNLMKRTDETVQEEVFVAALLYHLGSMAFWCSGGKAADEVESLIQAGNHTKKEAFAEVTGTSLKAITKGLAEVWSLGDTLKEALTPSKTPSPKAIAVRLGEELSRTAEHGWDSQEVGETIYKFAKFTRVGFPQAQKSAMESADEAAEVALTYGAAKVCHLIPNSHSMAAPTVAVEERAIMKADPQLQLNILRELANALNEKLDVNTIFQMVLEGLHRGIGLERVCVAFIQKETMSAKYVLGEGTESWRESFRFSLSPMEDSIFTHAARKGEPVWLDVNKQPRQKYLYNPEVKKVIGEYPAFMAVIKIGKRDVAMFYADRWDKGGSLDDEQFESFRHFISQTQVSLEMLSNNRH